MQKVKLIYDRDHGTANEGWYVREIDEHGQETDTPIDADDLEDAIAQTQRLTGAFEDEIEVIGGPRA